MQIVMKNDYSLPQKVDDFIAQKSLFSKSDLIVVAVSGGADSITLLHILHTLGYKIHCAHLNHGLRDESILESEYVQLFCQKVGISCTLDIADTPADMRKNGGSVQQAARRLRYTFLHSVADKVGANHIATAHNRNDLVETILLKIIRGTSIQGLRGIPIKYGRLVRPLLNTARHEIEKYCIENDLKPRHDKSNDSTKYSRNEVRHILVPYLHDRFNERIDDAVIRLSEIASVEDDYLNSIASTWLYERPTPVLSEIKLLHPALQRRVIGEYAKSNWGLDELSFETIENIRLKLGDAGSLSLPGNVNIFLENDIIAKADDIDTTLCQSQSEISVAPPSELIFGDWKISLSGEIPTTVSLVIRTLHPGDKMPFSFGHKKITDIMRESKIPLKDRGKVPLLVDKISEEVIAVLNVIVSESYSTINFIGKKIELV
jgi:tRNA(Ile)-lysidine synthase